MGPTALQNYAESLGGLGVAEYRGALTTTGFGDPQAELEALYCSCGVYDLGYRAKLVITGGDRMRWLNGMVTNNVRDLVMGQGVYTFLLNPQGHILGDLYVYNRGESLMVDTDQSQVEKILATFDHYIIMDDVEAKNISEQMTALGIAGPRAREIARACGIEIPEVRPLQIFDATCNCDCDCTRCTCVRGESTEPDSYELWLNPGDLKKTWDALVAHGAKPVGSDALELLRIKSGIPLYGVDIRERDLPQETEQARALNFNKGCYIGQEIVERIRSRGSVHRKFTGFVWINGDSVAPGTKIVVGEKEVGEITSARLLGENHPGLALGYIRREFAVRGKEVLLGTTPARVWELPFGKL